MFNGLALHGCTTGANGQPYSWWQISWVPEELWCLSREPALGLALVVILQVLHSELLRSLRSSDISAALTSPRNGTLRAAEVCTRQPREVLGKGESCCCFKNTMPARVSKETASQKASSPHSCDSPTQASLNCKQLCRCLDVNTFSIPTLHSFMLCEVGIASNLLQTTRSVL